MLFAIADLHLSFDNPEKSMEAFSGWENYSNRLRSNWERIVTENDTVVLAGDISWAMKLSNAEKDFSFLDSLPGKKIILKGNHDYWWETKKKLDCFFSARGFNTINILHNNAYDICGLAICGSRGWLSDPNTSEDKKILAREIGRLRISVQAGVQISGEIVVFLHYPPIYMGAVCDDLIEVMKSAGVKRCYYGHIHGSAASIRAFQGKYDGIEFRLISADYLGFTPLLINK